MQQTMRRKENIGMDDVCSKNGEGNSCALTLNSPVHCLTHKGYIKVGMIIGFYGRLKACPSPSHCHDGESVHGRHHRKHTTAARGSDRSSGGVGVESSSCALLGHH